MSAMIASIVAWASALRSERSKSKNTTPLAGSGGAAGATTGAGTAATGSGSGQS
jgi:hypothetical protein